MMTEKEISDFAAAHRVGFCKPPKNPEAFASIRASSQFMAPKRVDLRDYCTPTEDQGSKPWCAAYAAANWAENIKWRVTDTIEQVMPDWIYAYAKQHDGDPNGEGTTLTDVLEALRGTLFNRDATRVKVIKPNRLSFKYAVHKFGAVLAGFNVTREWFGVTRDNPVITGATDKTGVGGHAVIVCGYDKDGVWISNSWGAGWGEYGFTKILWPAFDAQIMYGAVLAGCLNGLDLNA